MQERIEVKVLPAHIELGCKEDSHECAVALAIGHQFPDHEVCVGSTTVTMYETSGEEVLLPATEYRLPVEASEFIQRFDTGLRCESFGFTMVRVR